MWQKLVSDAVYVWCLLVIAIVVFIVAVMIRHTVDDRCQIIATLTAMHIESLLT
jgi:hypothetical protein